MHKPAARYELSWITENLAMGHAPMSYADLSSIGEQGVGAIMNLCAEFCDLHEIEEKHGFEVYYLPVFDNEAPAEPELERALDWLDEAVYLGKKVLVHCRYGVGRTATFVAAYLLRKGFGLKLARKKVEEARTMSSSFSQWRLLRKYSKKSGRLTIREPSLETRRIVDLSPFFRDYEALLEWVDEVFRKAAEIDSGLSSCGSDNDRCCYEYVEISFVEAAYLSHHMNRTLPASKRGDAIERAVQVAKRVREIRRASATDTCRTAVDDRALKEAYGASRILCPLSVDGKCGMYAFRPVACRIFGLAEDRQRGQPAAGPDEAKASTPDARALNDQVRSTLAKISADLLYALTSLFPEGDALTFALADAVSGRFIQTFFECFNRSQDDGTIRGARS
jgi:Fe-S-cluster containining protein